MKWLNVTCIALLAVGQSRALTNAELLNGLRWRSIGPAVMGGRITDIVGVPGDLGRVYVASASGGLFRTENGGTTWLPIFDRQSTISIGALAVEPGNPNAIWVGTGESNLRNSVSFGDGVYKSTDGGATWASMGLRDTQTISRIVIDPNHPEHVLVAAVGHASGPNADRGVFVTSDGGKSWKKTLFVDPEHGAVGLEMDPRNPQIVYAGLWHFDRKPWTYTSGSEHGGVFKSEDGGLTWHKLTTGLPSLLGRVSVKVSPQNSSVVYVIAESREGTLFRSSDGGASFQRVSGDRELVGRAYYFTDLRIAPDQDDHLFVLADALLESRDGGKQFRRASPSVHGDLHALWIDPKEPRRMWQGNDGGLAVSYDGGGHWEQINNLPLGQLYHVSADTRKPFYHVTVGMQDDGSWTGPSRTREPAGIFNDDWQMLNAFTGFASLADAEDPDVVISEQPGGTLLRTNTRTREQQVISPQPQNFGGAPARAMPYRFNWDAPLVRSPFGKNTMYLAGNVVFQSSDAGRSWETMSRDLTSADTTKLGDVGGPISKDNSASEVYATITALAESPARRNLLWAGTDDGNLQLTTDGGGHWTNVVANLRGLAPHSPVSHVEPSSQDPNVAYVSFDRHMFDDFKPYIFRTGDGGRTWREIGKGLPPRAFVWTIRQDLRSPRLLYAGTELGLYVSVDDGNEWVAMHGQNMPASVAVRDIVFQPEQNDLLVATHGRSLWILDDLAPLQAMAGNDWSPGRPALFAPGTALRYSQRASRFGIGEKPFIGTNPAYGAKLQYYVPPGADEAKLQIVRGDDEVVQTLPVTRGTLQQTTWNLHYSGLSAPGRGRESPGPQALPGRYTARLIVGSKTMDRPFQIVLDDTIAVKDAELQAEFEMAQDLTRMRRETGKLIEGLAAMPPTPESRALLASLRRPRDAGRSEAPAGLQEDLESLFTMVDSVNAAPTGAQRAFHQALKERVAAASQSYRKIKQPGS